MQKKHDLTKALEQISEESRARIIFELSLINDSVDKTFRSVKRIFGSAKDEWSEWGTADTIEFNVPEKFVWEAINYYKKEEDDCSIEAIADYFLTPEKRWELYGEVGLLNSALNAVRDNRKSCPLDQKTDKAVKVKELEQKIIDNFLEDEDFRSAYQFAKEHDLPEDQIRRLAERELFSYVYESNRLQRVKNYAYVATLAEEIGRQKIAKIFWRKELEAYDKSEGNKIFSAHWALRAAQALDLSERFEGFYPKMSIECENQGSYLNAAYYAVKSGDNTRAAALIEIVNVVEGIGMRLE